MQRRNDECLLHRVVLQAPQVHVRIGERKKDIGVVGGEAAGEARDEAYSAQVHGSLLRGGEQRLYAIARLAVPDAARVEEEVNPYQ